MYFTSNHDENSWNGTEQERMGEARHAFAALTYVLPGMPLIYSGQEVGFNRRLAFFEKDSIDWTSPSYSYVKNENTITNFYKSLIAFKKSNPALFTQEKGGEMVEIKNDMPEKVWSFKRVKGENEVQCLFNFSNEDVLVRFEDSYPGADFKQFSDGAPSVPTISIALKPWEYKLFYKGEKIKKRL